MEVSLELSINSTEADPEGRLHTGVCLGKNNKVHKCWGSGRGVPVKAGFYRGTCSWVCWGVSVVALLPKCSVTRLSSRRTRMAGVAAAQGGAWALWDVVVARCIGRDRGWARDQQLLGFWGLWARLDCSAI